MRILFAAALPPWRFRLSPMAQTPAQEYRENTRDAQRDCNRDLRRADSRANIVASCAIAAATCSEASANIATWRRDWRQYRNYDYNRLPRGRALIMPTNIIATAAIIRSAA
jgi:hypothetical protein